MKRFKIRPVFDSNCGCGYELVRLRWFGRQYICREWIRHDKNAFETLRLVADHLGGVVVK